MFKLELTAYDALYLGKILIDHLQNDPKYTEQATSIWGQLVATIEKGK